MLHSPAMPRHPVRAGNVPTTLYHTAVTASPQTTTTSQNNNTFEQALSAWEHEPAAANEQRSEAGRRIRTAIASDSYYVLLTHLGLRSVPPFPECSNIRVLYLACNELTSLPEQWPPLLTQITLHNNHLQQLPTQILTMVECGCAVIEGNPVAARLSASQPNQPFAHSAPQPNQQRKRKNNSDDSATAGRAKRHTPSNKKYPYFSTKRDATTNLNGKAVRSDKAATTANRSIVCRHLAMLWEKNFISEGGKVDYSRFSDVQKISASTTQQTDHANSNRRLTSKTAMISNSEWGQEISRQFRQMETRGETLHSIYVITVNHSMVLGLKIKPGKDGSKRYVIHFYDPNATLAHRRVVVGHLSSLSKLTAKDFLKEQLLNFYELPGENSHCAFLGRISAADEDRLERIPASWSAQSLFLLMHMNLAAGLRQFKFSQHAMTPDQQFALLMGKRSDGITGIWIAVMAGYTEVISVFGEILEHSGLTSEQKTALLATRVISKYGIPAGLSGLGAALQQNKADAIRAYGAILTKIGLSQEQRAQLLNVKRADGVSSLEVARERGHTEAVAAYTEIVEQADLTPEQKNHFLEVGY